MYQEMVLEKPLLEKLLSSQDCSDSEGLIASLASLDLPEISIIEPEGGEIPGVDKVGYVCRIPGDYPVESVSITPQPCLIY